MELEIIILSEVSQICICIIRYHMVVSKKKKTLKNGTTELIYKRETDS